MSKNENLDDVKKEDDTLIRVFTGAIALVFLPITVLYLLAGYLAERPSIWVLLKRNALKIRFAALTSAITIFCTAIPLAKFAINASNPWRICSLLLIWVVSIPLAIWVMSIKFRQIYSEVKDNLHHPSKAIQIKSALEVADFENAKSRYQHGQLPERTRNGNIPIGYVADLEFLGRAHKKLNAHKTSNLNDVIDGQYSVFPLNEATPQHSLVIAETGAGKTVLLSRMALSALSNKWRVVVIDFKGATDEAKLYCSLPSQLGHNAITYAFPHQPLDLFWGDANTVSRRIIGFLPPMPEGSATFYWSRQATAIRAVIERTHSNLLPPKSFPELLDRIRNASQFALDPNDRNMLLAKEHGRLVCEEIAGVLGTYFEHLRDANPNGNSHGFSLASNWDLLFYSFNGMDIESVKLGSTIISEFSYWIDSDERKMLDRRPVLLIVDEASALMALNGSPPLASLIQRARSLKVAVVVASQTLTSLDKTGDEILKSGCIRYIGRTAMPEDLISATGTKGVVEVAHQYDERTGYTGVQTIREQEAFLINPNTVRRLPNLCWIATGRGLKTPIFVPWI